MVQNHFSGACGTPRIAGIHPYFLPIEWFVGTVWRRMVHLPEKSCMAILWKRFWSSLFDPFFLCAFVSKHLWSYQKKLTFLDHNCLKQQGGKKSYSKCLKILQNVPYFIVKKHDFFQINEFYRKIIQCCSIAGGFRPTMWVTGFDDRFKWNVWEWGDPSRSRHSRHMCPKCPTIFKATFFFNIITLASQTFMPKKVNVLLKSNQISLDYLSTSFSFFLGSNYWAHRVLILRYRNSGGVLSRLHVSSPIKIPLDKFTIYKQALKKTLGLTQWTLK